VKAGSYPVIFFASVVAAELTLMLKDAIFHWSVRDVDLRRRHSGQKRTCMYIWLRTGANCGEHAVIPA
jgi:hypothetical protein